MQEMFKMKETRRKPKDSLKYVHIQGPTARVELPGGQEALIDAQDVPLVGKYLWSLNTIGYAKTGSSSRLMRRLIMGSPPGLEIDHINHDRLDNRRDNLRVCTRHQNQRNRSHSAGTRFPFKGVFQTTSGRFGGQIYARGRKRNLGTYDTPTQAAKAYDQAAQEHFGEFAQLNFPSIIT